MMAEVHNHAAWRYRQTDAFLLQFLVDQPANLPTEIVNAERAGTPEPLQLVDLW